MVLLGKPLSWSSLTRRSIKIPTASRSSAPTLRRTASRSSSGACRIGFIQLSRNWLQPPKTPGCAVCIKHQKSPRLFSTGVPVANSLKSAFKPLAAWVCSALGFLMFCASSKITMPQSIMHIEN